MQSRRRRRLHGTAEESVYQTQAITKHTIHAFHYITFQCTMDMAWILWLTSPHKQAPHTKHTEFIGLRCACVIVLCHANAKHQRPLPHIRTIAFNCMLAETRIRNWPPTLIKYTHVCRNDVKHGVGWLERHQK